MFNGPQGKCDSSNQTLLRLKMNRRRALFVLRWQDDMKNLHISQNIQQNSPDMTKIFFLQSHSNTMDSKKFKITTHWRDLIEKQGTGYTWGYLLKGTQGKQKDKSVGDDTFCLEDGLNLGSKDPAISGKPFSTSRDLKIGRNCWTRQNNMWCLFHHQVSMSHWQPCYKYSSSFNEKVNATR